MRRPDPLEQRARELAIAAGVDPDGRIERPGQRSMPAWCAYRDAARAEHVGGARRLRRARARRRRRPNIEDAPLQSLRRARRGHRSRRCATAWAVGNVVAGVICADGHLGYAQPVGGVIAYEKQISISGVGFDIGCGNMAVRLDTPFARDRGQGRRHHQGRRASDLVRRRPQSTRSASSMRCSTTPRPGAVRHGGLPAEGRRRSSAPSAPATTMST